MEQIMNTFLTPANVGTFAVAVVLTVLFTSLLKGLPGIVRIPTRIFSYIIALAILIAVEVVFRQPSAASILLCVFNALLVALAAQASFDIVTQGASISKYADAFNEPVTEYELNSASGEIMPKTDAAAAKVQGEIKPPDAN
jgi:hypothetical protein